MTRRAANSLPRAVLLVALAFLFALAAGADLAQASTSAVQAYDYDTPTEASPGYDIPSTTTTPLATPRAVATQLEQATTGGLQALSPRISPRRATKDASSGWRVGNDIWAATRAGHDPAWSTVRGRYWKSVANDPAQAAQWDAANVARMKAGKAPQRFNPDKGGMESMELSHEWIPAREGGRRLVPRWPQDHAAVDPYRRPGY